MDWEKHLEKICDEKLEKKYSKNQSQIASREQQNAIKKPNFCSNTVSRRKTIHFFDPLPVSESPKSLHQFDFITHKNV